MKKLFVVSGPAGSGKSTLVSMLLARDARITRPVTHTTRAPRPGEVDGVHYHFRTQEQFFDMVGAGEFVEFAKVHGNLYGTSVKSINAVQDEQIAVLILDCEGADRVRWLYPSCTTLFISAPLPELRTRMLGRGQDSDAEISIRLGNAEAEMSHANEFHHVIVNMDVAQAFDRLREIVLGETICQA